MTEAVRTSHEGDVALITIDRPEKRNALDSATARAVRSAIEEASSTRVIILTGSGRSFCAGGDLEELARWTDLDPDQIAKTLYEGFQGMIQAIRRADAVVIAAVTGAAVGAGMDLALACDLRVAGESSKFGQVWVGLGVIPGTGGAWFTQALAGSTAAAELLLTGDIIDAQRALELGLVNEVCADDLVVHRAHALAQRVLKNPKDGVVANKRAMIEATQPHVDAALEHAKAVQPGRFTSEEFRAAVNARLKRE